MQHCEGASVHGSRKVLARKIAERLIAIAEDVNTESDTFTVVDILETVVTSFSLNQGELQLTWSRVGQLYTALSRLLTQTVYSVHSGEDLELTETWVYFNKVWQTVLRIMSTWIADNGGWVSSLAITKHAQVFSLMAHVPV